MLSELRKRKLRRFFQVLDRDNDGVITAEDPEVVVKNLAALRDLAPGMPRFENFRGGFMAYWGDLMKRSDANKDGAVTLDEWLGYHEIMLADETRFEHVVAFSAGVMFALMDADEDGRISLEEYGMWMAAWGIDVAEMPRELFDRLDRNGDGTLSQEEVLELTHEFYYSDDPDAPGNWCMGRF